MLLVAKTEILLSQTALSKWRSKRKQKTFHTPSSRDICHHCNRTETPKNQPHYWLQIPQNWTSCMRPMSCSPNARARERWSVMICDVADWFTCLFPIRHFQRSVKIHFWDSLAMKKTVPTSNTFFQFRPPQPHNIQLQTNSSKRNCTPYKLESNWIVYIHMMFPPLAGGGRGPPLKIMCFLYYF